MAIKGDQKFTLHHPVKIIPYMQPTILALVFIQFLSVLSAYVPVSDKSGLSQLDSRRLEKRAPGRVFKKRNRKRAVCRQDLINVKAVTDKQSQVYAAEDMVKRCCGPFSLRSESVRQTLLRVQESLYTSYNMFDKYTVSPGIVHMVYDTGKCYSDEDETSGMFLCDLSPSYSSLAMCKKSKCGMSDGGVCAFSLY
jgi:hypothetical protein